MPQTTRFRDRYGLTLTTNSMTAVEGYVQGIDQFLAAELGADTSLAQAIEADAGFRGGLCKPGDHTTVPRLSRCGKTERRARSCMHGRPLGAGATICRGHRHVR